MRQRRVLGVVVGLLAAAAGLGAAEGLAAVASGPSPVYAVGTWAIDASPRWLTKWAIEQFGENDKQVLIGGMVVTMALVAALGGLLGTYSKRLALGLSTFMWLIGIVAVATVRGAEDSFPVRVGPTVLALVVGTAALAWLLSVLPAAPTAAPAAAEADAPKARFSLAERTPPADVVPSREMPAVIVPGRRPGAYDRRGFMQAAGTVGAVAIVGGVAREIGGSSTSGLGKVGNLPAPFSPAKQVVKADFQLAKLSPYFTPNSDFYRVDTSIVVPRVNANSWRLKITGMVENPITLTYEDLLRAKTIERDVTLCCISNEVGGDLVGNARWLGVPIRDILAIARPKPGADAVQQRSVDGWTCGTPLSALTDPKRDAMLAIGMNGVPLPVNHGYPVRMVVPGLYGYVSATKWVTEIEVTRFDAFEAYWTKRGWAVEGPVKTQSRIELPVPYAEIAPGKTTIAGVAWAQHRGISKVEVQVGEPDAPWLKARLAPWDNKDTWRQWELDYDFGLGTQNIAVRATDGKGVTQTEIQTPPIPDGAAGWHSVLTQVQKNPITS
ncbi:MAG: molybdopterin-dependent oxidoreductase [Sporichthyaceae bacterium]